MSGLESAPPTVFGSYSGAGTQIAGLPLLRGVRARCLECARRIGVRPPLISDLNLLRDGDGAEPPSCAGPGSSGGVRMGRRDRGGPLSRTEVEVARDYGAAAEAESGRPNAAEIAPSSGCFHAASPVAQKLSRDAPAAGTRRQRLGFRSPDLRFALTARPSGLAGLRSGRGPGNQLAKKKRKGTLLRNGTWGHF
jgi:hypothetical protein